MKPEGNLSISWGIYGYSDMYYSSNNNIHEIMTEYVILINGLIISYNSQSELKVILSVTEAEYSEVREVY